MGLDPIKSLGFCCLTERIIGGRRLRCGSTSAPQDTATVSGNFPSQNPVRVVEIARD
jgi:hypothetical protein